ncbi:unnamed protein product [Cochlearia groenlandica]
MRFRWPSFGSVFFVSARLSRYDMSIQVLRFLFLCTGHSKPVQYVDTHLQVLLLLYRPGVTDMTGRYKSRQKNFFYIGHGKPIQQTDASVSTSFLLEFFVFCRFNAPKPEIHETNQNATYMTLNAA